jgi:hypothetical protein
MHDSIMYSYDCICIIRAVRNVMAVISLVTINSSRVPKSSVINDVIYSIENRDTVINNAIW